MRRMAYFAPPPSPNTIRARLSLCENTSISKFLSFELVFSEFLVKDLQQIHV